VISAQRLQFTNRNYDVKLQYGTGPREEHAILN